MTRYFHFTIGPVQGFVAQARRTKDFWAGSFLLSYLSGVAMIATKKRGGKILFPLPDDEYLGWIEGKGSGKPPRQGNIPNRFKAEVEDGFDAKKITEAVQGVWTSLCESVWSADLKHFDGTKTREIWNRQIGSFWEISWAISDDKAASNLLDRRKNWRTHISPPEGGQKCSIMAGFAELSGVDAPQSQELKKFWSELKVKNKNFDLDIKDSEQLCALAFVKRRFTRYFKDFRTTIDGYDICGWELDSNVPSVALLAAAPWLAAAIQKAPTQKINALVEASKKASNKGAALIKLKCIDDASKSKSEISKDIFGLDGMTLFESTLESEKFDKGAAEAMKQALRDLKKELDDKAPSPFYAILLMDGDELGKQMSDGSKQEAISKALNEFTKNVPSIIKEHSGFLIYAGGDDVLAILPLEEAFGCASRLRAHYEKVFKSAKETNGVQTSISAAITYAHIKTPLHGALAGSHHLLDNVAKEGTGRDALAIQVVKPGGVNNTWAQPWEIALQEGSLEEIAKNYQKQIEGGHYSNSFFYRIKEIGEIVSSFADEGDMVELLAAEFRTGTNLKQDDAKKIITPLLNQCLPRFREIDKKPNKWKKGQINADGALIVKFLAQKGVEG